MNLETKNFLVDNEFEILFQELSAQHRPIKPKFSKKRLESIGYLITRFQRLEHTMTFFIGLLANISNDRLLIHSLFSKQSFKSIILILESVAIQKNFFRIGDLKLLLNKALKAEEIRNQLIHSIWTTRGRIKTSLKYGKGVHTVFEEYSDQELYLIAEMIDKIDTSIDAIKFDYIDFCHKNGIHLNGVKFIISE